MNRNLDDLARQERLKYYKKWRDENKDKVKKYNSQYWKKRIEKQIKEVDNVENEDD